MKNKKNIAWLLCSALLFSTPIFATNYYTSPDGTGDGLSPTTPCAIGSSWAKLTAPGDTLFLRGGVYYLNDKQTINKTVTEIARMCI